MVFEMGVEVERGVQIIPHSDLGRCELEPFTKTGGIKEEGDLKDAGREEARIQKPPTVTKAGHSQ